MVAALSVVGGGFGVKALEFVWSRFKRGDEEHDQLVEYLRREIADLRERMGALESRVEEERTAKHALREQLQAMTIERDALRVENAELRGRLNRGGE